MSEISDIYPSLDGCHPESVAAVGSHGDMSITGELGATRQQVQVCTVEIERGHAGGGVCVCGVCICVSAVVRLCMR